MSNQLFATQPAGNGRPIRPERDASVPDSTATLASLPLAVVDVETTDLRPGPMGRVCEIAVLRVPPGGDPGPSPEPWSTLIAPGCPLAPNAARVNGLTNEELADAPPFEAVAPALLRQLHGAVIIAHNAPFDLGFLRHELLGAGHEPAATPAIDTLLLARRWYRFRSNKLGEVARELGVPTGRLHRAAADVAVTWGIFARMRQRLEPMGMRTLAAWLAAQGSRPTLATPGDRAGRRIRRL